MTIVLVPNPRVPAGSTGEPACHDRSKFLTFRCGCGGELHVHETQFARADDRDEVALRCPFCRLTRCYGAGELRDAIGAAWEPRELWERRR